VWAKYLVHSATSTPNGEDGLNLGYYTIPLPIDNPSSLIERILYINECPVCGYGFKCRNITVGECGCTYHPFYLIGHLSSGIKAYSSIICAKVFFDVWLESSS
jgi:hypothetical protein